MFIYYVYAYNYLIMINIFMHIVLYDKKYGKPIFVLFPLFITCNTQKKLNVHYFHLS